MFHHRWIDRNLLSLNSVPIHGWTFRLCLAYPEMPWIAGAYRNRPSSHAWNLFGKAFYYFTNSRVWVELVRWTYGTPLFAVVCHRLIIVRPVKHILKLNWEWLNTLQSYIDKKCTFLMWNNKLTSVVTHMCDGRSHIVYTRSHSYKHKLNFYRLKHYFRIKCAAKIRKIKL